SRLARTAIGGAHRAGAAAGGDDVATDAAFFAQRAAALGCNTAELTRLVIPEWLFVRALFLSARTAKDDDRRPDLVRLQYLISLFVLEHKTHAASRLTEQEIRIQRRKAIRGRGFLFGV